MHLIVVMHGMWGNSAHMDQVVAALRQLAASPSSSPSSSSLSSSPRGVMVGVEEGVVVHNCRALSFFHTYQGIDACGLRLRDDVMEFVTAHNAAAAAANDASATGSQNRAISRISFVGYSAGGLFSRYCIALLLQEGFFDAVRPSHFVTIATPHLGTRWASRRTSGRIMNAVAGCVVGLYAGRTGRQLYFVDGEAVGRGGCSGQQQQSGAREAQVPLVYRPLLVEMADPDGPYYAALARFPHIYVYANVSNDNTVPYCTSSLSHYNKWKEEGAGTNGNKTVDGEGNTANGQMAQQQYVLEVVRVSADGVAVAESAQDSLKARPQLDGAAPPRESNWLLALYTVSIVALLAPFALVHFILVMLPIKLISLCYARPDPARLLPRQPRTESPGPDDAPWVALRALRSLHIHRVSVFIPGGHTHGKVICRFQPNEGGLEVVRHVAANLLLALTLTSNGSSSINSSAGSPVASVSTSAAAPGAEARLGVEDVGLCEED